MTLAFVLAPLLTTAVPVGERPEWTNARVQVFPRASRALHFEAGEARLPTDGGRCWLVDGARYADLTPDFFGEEAVLRIACEGKSWAGTLALVVVQARTSGGWQALAVHQTLTSPGQTGASWAVPVPGHGGAGSVTEGYVVLVAPEPTGETAARWRWIELHLEAAQPRLRARRAVDLGPEELVAAQRAARVRLDDGRRARLARIARAESARPHDAVRARRLRRELDRWADARIRELDVYDALLARASP